jgi:hypothetical protein
MRRMAAERRAVLMSSHLMSEMELTADHLIVIGRGRLIADMTMKAFIEAHSDREVLLRSPQIAELRRMLATAVNVRTDGPDGLLVTGLEPAEIGAHHGGPSSPPGEDGPPRVRRRVAAAGWASANSCARVSGVRGHHWSIHQWVILPLPHAAYFVVRRLSMLE